MLIRAQLLALVLLAGGCAHEHVAADKIAEAASGVTSTLAVARATIQRFAPAADPFAKLPTVDQARAQLTEAIVVTFTHGVAALLTYLAARRTAATAAAPDAGVPLDAGVP